MVESKHSFTLFLPEINTEGWRGRCKNRIMQDVATQLDKVLKELSDCKDNRLCFSVVLVKPHEER